ncbi:hypothetical protein CLOM_g21506 [Closterium sp. NIES-68]|nr:hypothetical protein CLOM_g21506 [Closterium sp. NIES-68]GJP81146.1 hypothetical protein CLOP_g11320 [Closterium sp. NIES-67]
MPLLSHPSHPLHLPLSSPSSSSSSSSPSSSSLSSASFLKDLPVILDVTASSLQRPVGELIEGMEQAVREAEGWVERGVVCREGRAAGIDSVQVDEACRPSVQAHVARSHSLLRFLTSKRSILLDASSRLASACRPQSASATPEAIAAVPSGGGGSSESSKRDAAAGKEEEEEGEEEGKGGVVQEGKGLGARTRGGGQGTSMGFGRGGSVLTGRGGVWSEVAGERMGEMGEEERVRVFVEWVCANGMEDYSKPGSGIEIVFRNETAPVRSATEGQETRRQLLVRAGRDHEEESVLLSIPKSLWLTTPAMLQAIGGPPYPGPVWAFTVAAAWLLREMLKTRTESFWWPYLQLLPRHVPLPYFFQEETLEELQAPSTVKTVYNNLANYEFEYRRCGPAVLANATFHEFMWALSVVQSRGFDDSRWGNVVTFLPKGLDASAASAGSAGSVGSGESSGGLPEERSGAVQVQLRKGALMLVPPAELFDHSNTFQTSYRFGADTLDFVASDSITQGEEVSTSYGLRSNEDLLVAYGFVLPGNMFDNAPLLPSLSYAVRLVAALVHHRMTQHRGAGEWESVHQGRKREPKGAVDMCGAAAGFSEVQNTCSAAEPATAPTPAATAEATVAATAATADAAAATVPSLSPRLHPPPPPPTTWRGGVKQKLLLVWGSAGARLMGGRLEERAGKGDGREEGREGDVGASDDADKQERDGGGGGGGGGRERGVRSEQGSGRHVTSLHQLKRRLWRVAAKAVEAVVREREEEGGKFYGVEEEGGTPYELMQRIRRESEAEEIVGGVEERTEADKEGSVGVSVWARGLVEPNLIAALAAVYYFLQYRRDPPSVLTSSAVYLGWAVDNTTCKFLSSPAPDMLPALQAVADTVRLLAQARLQQMPTSVEEDEAILRELEACGRGGGGVGEEGEGGRRGGGVGEEGKEGRLEGYEGKEVRRGEGEEREGREEEVDWRKEEEDGIRGCEEWVEGGGKGEKGRGRLTVLSVRCNCAALLPVLDEKKTAVRFRFNRKRVLQGVISRLEAACPPTDSPAL